MVTYYYKTNEEIGIKILKIFYHDGYTYHVEADGLIHVKHPDTDAVIYESWYDLLNDWRESVQIDCDNGLIYLNEIELDYLGIV